jgi:hypothetical protein
MLSMSLRLGQRATSDASSLEGLPDELREFMERTTEGYEALADAIEEAEAIVLIEYDEPPPTTITD